mmetsp:Transcript_55522/g.130020  ORF Transcript_55522/g.130020 Transcript_55522/m.130020 type:complete len:208 (-) Transcript_55522:302-925(-)
MTWTPPGLKGSSTGCKPSQWSPSISATVGRTATRTLFRAALSRLWSLCIGSACLRTLRCEDGLKLCSCDGPSSPHRQATPRCCHTTLRNKTQGKKVCSWVSLRPWKSHLFSHLLLESSAVAVSTACLAPDPGERSGICGSACTSPSHRRALFSRGLWHSLLLRLLPSAWGWKPSPHRCLSERVQDAVRAPRPEGGGTALFQEESGTR